MLSSVSKLVDKAFFLGYLLPALLAVFAALQVFGCPTRFSAYCTIDAANPFANLTYIALLVYILAILLLSVNFAVYRVFEGYTLPTRWLWWLYDWHVRRFRRLTAERAAYVRDGKTSEASALRRTLLAAYPTHEQHILPTAFGNALRAFEVYSSDVYGADAIPVWLRLAAVVPKNFQDLISDAKSQVDFFVNIALLSAIFAVASWIRLGMDMFATRSVAWPPNGGALVWGGVAAFATAYCSYRWAIVQVAPWGDLVKSAFDLYLPALGKQIGYVLPPKESRRFAFWLAFSKLALYRRQFADGAWAWADISEAKTSGSAEKAESADKEKDASSDESSDPDSDSESDDGENGSNSAAL